MCATTQRWGVGAFIGLFCLTGELSQHCWPFKPCSRWRCVANRSSATSGSSELYAQPKWHNILAPGQSSVTNNCTSYRRNLNECSHNILTALFKENDWQLYQYHLFNNACLQQFYSCYVPTTLTNFDIITGHYQHSHRMKNSLWHKNCFRLRLEWRHLIKHIHKTGYMPSAMREKNLMRTASDRVTTVTTQCTTEYDIYSFFTVFKRVRKNCENRLLASSCLSVRQHGTSQLPLDGFS
jgi:hypothetical protein